MRQHQRRIGGKSAEYLSCLGIVERVKTALKRFAVKRQYTRTRGNRTLLDAADVRRYFASLPAYRPKVD